MNRNSMKEIVELDSLVWLGERVGLSDTNFGQQTIFMLDGTRMKDEETVLAQFREQLNLPEGMGYNFDSLDECLSEFDWPNTRQLLLIIKNADQFFGNCEKETLDTVLSVLVDATNDWQRARNDKHAFCVVLDSIRLT